MPEQDVVDRAVADIASRTAAAGKAVSVQMRITPETPERVAAYLALGARMVTVSPLDFIRNGAPALLGRLRDEG